MEITACLKKNNLKKLTKEISLIYNKLRPSLKVG